jgi:hypothetical protein
MLDLKSVLLLSMRWLMNARTRGWFSQYRRVFRYQLLVWSQIALPHAMPGMMKP